MVILVINGKGIPNVAKLVEMLDDAIAELPPAYEDGPEYSLESVVVNVNKGKSADIFGDECITVAGKPTITEIAGGMAARLGSRRLMHRQTMLLQPWLFQWTRR